MDELSYYRQQSNITDPKEFAGRFEDLPSSVSGLVEIVQGVVVDKDLLELYGAVMGEHQKTDMDTRYVRDILNKIFNRNDSSLTKRRSLTDRFVGSCRDYAVMLCAILRHQGVPARLRCGFDYYFNIKANLYDDHWICEYWHDEEKRWVGVDANVDEIVKKKYKITINPLDVKPSEFITAGKAWQMARSGQVDTDRFGVSSIGIKGLWFIRGSVVRDIAALNKFEVLPWDYWGIADQGENDWPEEDWFLLDNAARLSESGRPIDAVMAVFNAKAFATPLKIKSYSPAEGVRLIQAV